jgi:hypothetical protein
LRGASPGPVFAKFDPPLDEDELLDEELLDDEDEPPLDEVLAVLKFKTNGVGFAEGIPYLLSVPATTMRQGVAGKHL